MSVAIIIPSRYASTRLSAKSLADLNGKPLFMWVYEACKKVKNVNQVILATDHQLVFNEAKAQKAHVLMTSDTHQSGTDRCAEVASHLSEDYVINVQGDEPFISPELLEHMIEHLASHPHIDILTLYHALHEENDIKDPSKVKLVKDKNGRILYFSRSVIPYQRSENKGDYFKHIGIYAFRREVLMQVAELPQSNLEKTEGLEQLRWIENGFSIYGLETREAPLGIDTKEDLEKARVIAKSRY
jgi:3-deoxy-manno-octulosonate cytidylyltransferase (CMP-KDO synthetase)